MTIQFRSADQALRKAKTFSRKGAIEDAQAAYRWVLDNYPSNKRAQEGLQTLGRSKKAGRPASGPTRDQLNDLIALHRQGRFGEALIKAQPVAALNPDVAFLQNFIGVCHAALGQLHKAVARYQRALELQPHDADIHANLGNVLNALDHTEEAVVCFGRAIELDPTMAMAHNNLGSALVKLGEMEGAAQSYGRAAAADPDMVDAHSNLGLALIKLGRINEGASACRRAIKLNPRFPLAHVNLAHAHDAEGETEEAVNCLETAIAMKPDHVGAYSNLCEIYDRLNRIDSLREVLTRAEENCDENDPRIRYRAAQLASRDIDHKKARQLLESMPDKGLTAPIAKGRLFLLAKTCDKLGDHAAAFNWFKQANALVMKAPQSRRWSPEAYRNEVEALTASFRDISEKPWPATVEKDAAAPVFLVGFPRSGTTLLDTILRSHPDIVVLEEMKMVFRMREHLDGVADFERLNSLSEEEVASLRQAYLDELRLQCDEAPDNALIIDKLPLNIIHAGLILRVFPTARFIFAQRHPCDCVLSCFMQNFKLNNPMANFVDLQDSAVLYDRVMDLWSVYRDRLGLNVHVLAYEDLVADLKGNIVPLLEFLDLQWNDSLLDYRETALSRGRINTPSYNQVTEALHNRAAGRWENYREQLAPVLPLLEPWAERFGY